MLDNTVKNLNIKLQKTLSIFKNDLASILINRLNLKIIQDLKVFCYNSTCYLNQLADIIMLSPRVVSIKPYDVANLELLVKSLRDFDSDLNPVIYENCIKLTLSVLTQDKRLLFIKKIKKLTEENKVAIRNIRRSVHKDIKKLSKKDCISLDYEKKTSLLVDNIIKKYITEIDDISSKKIREISII